MHELDRTDMLGKYKIPIDRMSWRDDGAIAAQPGQRDMRPKGPIVRLFEGGQKHCTQLRHLRFGHAFHPQKTRTSGLWSVPYVPKFQGKVVTSIGDAAKLLDRIRYRKLVPRRHQRQMKVGRSDKPNRKFLHFARHFCKFVGNRGRNLEGDKNSCRPRTACARNSTVSFARSAFRGHGVPQSL